MTTVAPLTRETIIPISEDHWHSLRALDITSTESAAMFGLSPYATVFELWHWKREAKQVQLASNERMAWGQYLQEGIARGIADTQGVMVIPLTEYGRIPDLRMGASFDFQIMGLGRDWTGEDTDLRRAYREHGLGILEIKNVDFMQFRDNWTINEDKTIEAPGHIEIQLQHQLHVVGYAWGAIGVLVGGNNPRIVVRYRDLQVGAAIETKVREFWTSINAGIAPDPTYPQDAAFVAKLHQYAEPGKLYDGREDTFLQGLCEEYRQAADRAQAAEEHKQTAKAQILARIGEAERAMLPGYSISASMVAPAEIPACTRSGFRNLRVTKKK